MHTRITRHAQAQTNKHTHALMHGHARYTHTHTGMYARTHAHATHINIHKHMCLYRHMISTLAINTNSRHKTAPCSLPAAGQTLS